MVTNPSFDKILNLVQGDVSKQKLDASIAQMNAIFRWVGGRRVLPQHSGPKSRLESLEL